MTAAAAVHAVCRRPRRELSAWLLLALWPLAGQADPIVYGSARAALQLAQQQDAAATSVASGGSFIGIKGIEDISSGGRALWRLESAVDISGEDAGLHWRDSYLGVEGGYGQLLAGTVETPYSKLRDKLTLFADSGADSRNLLGAASGAGNLLDERARNMLQYQSPRLLDMLTGSVLYAGGNHDASTANAGGDDHRYELTSASLQLRLGPVFGGAAWQRQLLPGRAEQRGARLGASVRFALNSIGVCYEKLWAGTAGVLDHSTYALHYSRSVGDDVFGVQWLAAGEQRGQRDSGAWQLAAGYTWRLSPALAGQLLWSRLVNGRGANYGNLFLDGDPASGGAGSGTVSLLSAGMQLDF